MKFADGVELTWALAVAGELLGPACEASLPLPLPAGPGNLFWRLIIPSCSHEGGVFSASFVMPSVPAEEAVFQPQAKAQKYLGVKSGRQSDDKTELPTPGIALT